MPEPSPILPASAVAALDSLLGDLRDDTCVITQPPTGRGIGGAPAGGAYTTVATVACRVKRANRQPVDRIYGGRLVPEADYEVHLPRTTALNASHRITVNGQELEVLFVPTAQSHGLEIIVPAKDVKG